jgi:hypothetical protein
MRKDALILGTLVALAAGWSPTAAAADTLLADWQFDEGAGQVVDDGVAHGHDGVLGTSQDPEDADPAWIPGHDGGSALHFDGDAFVTVPDTPALEPAHPSVEAWVRSDGSPGEWRYIVAKGAVECDRSAYGLYSGPGGGMAFYVSDATHYVRSPEAPPDAVWDGAWHHVVGTYDGQRVRVAIDGAEVGDGSATTLQISYGTGSKGVYIGNYRGSCDRPFAGDIDGVRIFGDDAVATGPPIAPVPRPGVPAAPGSNTVTESADGFTTVTHGSIRASAKLSGLHGNRPKLVVRFIALKGPRVRSVGVGLPGTLRVDRKRLKAGTAVLAGGRAARSASVSLTGREVAVARLPKGGTKALELRMGRPGLSVANGVKPGRRVKLGLAVVDTAGARAKLTLRVRAGR